MNRKERKLLDRLHFDSELRYHWNVKWTGIHWNIGNPFQVSMSHLSVDLAFSCPCSAAPKILNRWSLRSWERHLKYTATYIEQGAGGRWKELRWHLVEIVHAENINGSWSTLFHNILRQTVDGRSGQIKTSRDERGNFSRQRLNVFFMGDNPWKEKKE